MVICSRGSVNDTHCQVKPVREAAKGGARMTGTSSALVASMKVAETHTRPSGDIRAKPRAAADSPRRRKECQYWAVRNGSCHRGCDHVEVGRIDGKGDGVGSRGRKGQ